MPLVFSHKHSSWSTLAQKSHVIVHRDSLDSVVPLGDTALEETISPLTAGQPVPAGLTPKVHWHSCFLSYLSSFISGLRAWAYVFTQRLPSCIPWPFHRHSSSGMPLSAWPTYGWSRHSPVQGQPDVLCCSVLLGMSTRASGVTNRLSIYNIGRFSGCGTLTKCPNRVISALQQSTGNAITTISITKKVNSWNLI